MLPSLSTSLTPHAATHPAARPHERRALRLLHQALPWLTCRDEALPRLALSAAGFLPVTLIAATAFGVAGLRELALYLLVPAVALAAGMILWRPRWATAALWALAAGIVATALYDLYRGSFLALGLMENDPIPHIGVALHLDPAWVFGYLWRYLGNGGGLAVAFVALGFRGVRAGVLYGLFVCSGLLCVLVVAPYGQEMLFPLSTTTVVMAVGGHVIYGGTLGWLTARTGRACAAARRTPAPPSSAWGSPSSR